MTSDRGLQPQRTTLAWTRTGVAASALAGVLLRGAFRSGSAFAVATAVVGVLGAVCVFACGSRAIRPARRQIARHEATCDLNGIRAVTAVAMAIGVLTTITAVVG